MTNFDAIGKQSIFLNVSNCAETKSFRLEKLEPSVFFSADIIHNDNVLNVYVRKTPFEVRLTISKQDAIIIQSQNFSKPDNHSLYPGEDRLKLVKYFGAEF